MPELVSPSDLFLAASSFAGLWSSAKSFLLILVGFSVVIFVHELGHFVMAKLARVRVDKFAIGFGREIFGFTRGETRYSFNILPLGGYVKMLGQEDFTIDKSGELRVKEDPHSFSNKSVGWRMLIVSAGVFMNLVFAALVFMVVFMIGFEFLSPVIGTPLPGTPAEQAGLQFGDRILEINGKKINDYTDITMAVVLAEPHVPLKMKIQRGTEVLEKEVQPENNPDKNLLQIGVPPKSTRVLAYVPPEPGPPRDDAPKAGDEVISIDGRPVNDYMDIFLAIKTSMGRRLTLEVDRPDPADPAKKTRMTVTRAPSYLSFAPTDSDPAAPGHFLGFVRRTRVLNVDPESPAAEAGIEVNDVIAQWANIVAPTPAEIARSVESNGGARLDVVVIRNGQRLAKKVTPRGIGLWGRGKPQVGFEIRSQEDDQLVVADIVEAMDGRPTPAASLRKQLRRGSTITRLNGVPVATWNELVQRCVELAGQDVQLSWRGENEEEQTHPMRVPPTLHSVGRIPFMAWIVDIDGQSSIEIVKPDGKIVVHPASKWKGAYEILQRIWRESPNKVVTVRYRDVTDRNGPIHTARVAVGEDMLDPWMMRIVYEDGLFCENDTIIRRARNPIGALWIGLEKTYDFILQAYLTMQRMVFDRTVGVENISGPVGIIKTGMEIAHAGTLQLLFFLGFLSANLAVLNFLPLPIVDGGLMVFLLIEKIRGTPVSLKTQVVTQIIGLALIITAFVFVTFMDISKL